MAMVKKKIVNNDDPPFAIVNQFIPPQQQLGQCFCLRTIIDLIKNKLLCCAVVL
jgi:hypothetical protein